GAQQIWMGEFCRRIMLRNWSQDAGIDDADSVLAALDGLVADPAAVLREAEGKDNKAALRAQTAAARACGIFGAPTFIVEGEMFWGDDRLEDALECAQARA
ncbi:MAG: 2-hydroxychromene-2-carboxylate isomerase, partial [Massilia sp.]